MSTSFTVGVLLYVYFGGILLKVCRLLDEGYFKILETKHALYRLQQQSGTVLYV